MRVLVTGGAGFIGSNLVWSLVGAGHNVGIIDDLSTGVASNLHPAAWFRTLDILDPMLPDLVAEFGPDAVVHLAAQSSVSVSMADPERDREVNAVGTRLVAEAAKAAGAKRVVSASSAAVYGEPAELPLAETSAKAPINPYGASKLEAETLLADAFAGSGVDFASMRFANVYGPRQNAEGEGGVVALFCAAIASGAAPRIYGDGSQTRDFIYVGDIVGAVVDSLLFEGVLAQEGPDGASYNVSTGSETSVEALLRNLRSVSSYLGPVDSLPAREGDIHRSTLSPAKLQDAVGWEARSGLAQGLGITWNWYTSQSR